MLLLSEDSIVRLQAVLLQELLSIIDLNVEQRVAHAKQLVRLGRHYVRQVRVDRDRGTTNG